MLNINKVRSIVSGLKVGGNEIDLSYVGSHFCDAYDYINFLKSKDPGDQDIFNKLEIKNIDSFELSDLCVNVTEYELSQVRATAKYFAKTPSRVVLSNFPGSKIDGFSVDSNNDGLTADNVLTSINAPNKPSMAYVFQNGEFQFDGVDAKFNVRGLIPHVLGNYFVGSNRQNFNSLEKFLRNISTRSNSKDYKFLAVRDGFSIKGLSSKNIQIMPDIACFSLDQYEKDQLHLIFHKIQYSPFIPKVPRLKKTDTFCKV